MAANNSRRIVFTTLKIIFLCIISTELLLHIVLRMLLSIDKDNRKYGQSFWEAFLDHYSRDLLTTYTAMTVLGVIFSIPFLSLYLLAQRRRLANSASNCIQCGYSLAELQGNKASIRCCPECGQEIPINH